MTKDFIEEKVQEFYSTFAGNKFEASFKRVKEDKDGKVVPYFMEDWIREALLAQKAEMLKTVEEENKLIAYQIRQLDGVVEDIDATPEWKQNPLAQGIKIVVQNVSKSLNALTAVKETLSANQ